MNRKNRDTGWFWRFFCLLALSVWAQYCLMAESGSAFQRGSYKEEIATWERNLQTAEKSGEKAAIAEAKSKLGAALLMERQYERAGTLLHEALDASRAEYDSKLTAAI